MTAPPAAPRRYGGTLLGFLVAPLAAAPFLAIVLAVWTGLADGSWGLLPRPFEFLTLLGALSLIGAPVAYAAAALIGVPAFLALGRRGVPALTHALAVGAVAGAATVVVVLLGFTDPVPLALVGAVAGAGSALVFWVCARRDRPGTAEDAS